MSIKNDLAKLETGARTFAVSKWSLTLPHWGWAVAGAALLLIGHVV